MGIKDGAKTVAKATAAGTRAVAVGYWRGLTFPFKGAKFVFLDHPKLVRFWIFPILITALLLAITAWVGWVSHEAVTNAIWTDPAAQVETLHKDPLADDDKPKPEREKHLEDESWGWLTATGHWVHSAFSILILLLIWSIGVLTAVLLTNVIAAPFNDLLSEEVEHLRTGRKGPPFTLQVLLRDSVRTIGLEALKMAIYFVIMAPLFIASNFVPFGQVVYSIFGFFFTALYFALDYIDWPASRRNRSTTYRFGLLTEHFMPMFGFGSGVWLFLFIPLVNLLFIPAVVAGGTLLFLELEGEEATPERTQSEPRVSPG